MFDWAPKFLTVDRITVDEEGIPDAEEVLAVEGFPPSGEAFIDLLDHQIRQTEIGRAHV